MLRIQKVGLVSVIIINLAFIAGIFLWTLEPDNTLLMNNLRTTQAIKVIDVLEQQDIEYNAERGALIVSPRDLEAIKTALQWADINTEDAAFYQLFKSNKSEPSKPKHIGQQPWFMKLMRLFAAAMVFIVLILRVMRPMLKDLIALNDTDKDNDEELNNG